MKKFIPVCLVTLTLAACALGLAACGETESTLLSYRVTGDGVCITGISDYTDTNLTVPKKIEGKPVTAIDDAAFLWCESITSVKLPDSIISIGSDAFYYESLSATTVDGAKYVEMNGNPYFLLLEFDNDEATSFSVNKKTKFIASRAFRSCDALTDLTIPNSVVNIGMGALEGCYALEHLTLSNNLQRLGDFALGVRLDKMNYNTYDNAKYLGSGKNPYLVLAEAKDEDITSCTVHSDTKFICDYAFYETEITSISLPKSVVQIGVSAFGDCEELETVTFGNGLKYIGGNAFSDCYKLNAISLPDSVTELGAYAFSDCRAATSLKLSSGLTEIAGGAFKDCYRLTSVTIPDGVKEIGRGAFDSCIDLKTISIPNSVTAIGYGAFRLCDKLTYNAYDTGLYLGNSSNPYLALLSTNSNVVTSCTVNDNTKVIAGGAFDSCRNLESITLPYGITYIGDDAFEYCYALKNITFNGTKAQWDAIEIYYGYQRDIDGAVVHCTDGELTIIEN